MLTRWTLALGLVITSVTPATEPSHNVYTQVQLIRDELARTSTPFPADTLKRLRMAGTEQDAAALHRALAEHVFLHVHINPEGRVKLTRGLAPLPLKQAVSALTLIRIDNASGGQQLLKPLGLYTGAVENPFTLKIVQHERFGTALMGLPVEYRLLEIRCQEQGLRELTIAMQAGQGTQDLGFRAEVPVLFTISK